MPKRTKTKSLLQQNQHLFNNVVLLTDFNCALSTASVELRLRNVFHYTCLQREKRTTLPEEVGFIPGMQAPEMPPVVTVHDIPNGHIDYAAYALYTSARALGRSGPNLFVHMTDPGVGGHADRAVLVTDLGNTYIGPNNGSLGMIAAYFQERGIPYTLYQIDCDRIEELEQYRMEEPSYHLPNTFHGRDVFAVVAGLLAGGVDVATFCTKLEGNHILSNPFSDTTALMTLKLREPMRFFTFRDNTFGNLKTNLTLDSLSFDQLAEENATFLVSLPAAEVKKGFFELSKQTSFKIHAREFYAQAKPGEAMMLLGSTFAPGWDEQFIDLAVNLGDAWAHFGLNKLGATGNRAQMLSIERLS